MTDFYRAMHVVLAWYCYRKSVHPKLQRFFMNVVYEIEKWTCDAKTTLNIQTIVRLCEIECFNKHQLFVADR